MYLTENDHVIPDAMIICNKDIIQKNGIHGAPDLVVEVLSPGTAKNDRGYKKDLYEKCGVKEYWIVEPDARSIEVYLLVNGKYILDEVYAVFPDYMVLTEEDRTRFHNSIPVSLYQDFSISLEDIFYGLF